MTGPIEQASACAPTTQRRDRLAVETNPRATLDYLCVLRGNTPDRETTLTLRYVPDKLILPAASFADYLTAFEDAGTLTPEALALDALDDINNEVVPRWVQVIVARGGSAGHEVIIEDRQPKWDNPALLSRLAHDL